MALEPAARVRAPRGEPRSGWPSLPLDTDVGTVRFTGYPTEGANRDRNAGLTDPERRAGKDRRPVWCNQSTRGQVPPYPPYRTTGGAAAVQTLTGPVAFVFGGGGMAGASEVGMVGALAAAGVRPDLVVGTSVGAINGVAVAADPTPAAAGRLLEIWTGLGASDVFASGPLRAMRTFARHGHLHSAQPLRDLLGRHVPQASIEELPVPFQCVAASIEQASAHWFTTGPLVDAVLASCAVPGLLPPVEIDGEHFVDGGIVDSIPVGRAVACGAKTVFVLHAGRVEQPLRPPQRPWETALVAFEIARRHRFAEEVAALPAGVRVHLLPTGADHPASVPIRYRATSAVRVRIERARAATADYLDRNLTRAAGPTE